MSFIKTLDDNFKALVFTKFKSDLDLTTQNTGIVLEPRDVSLRKIAEKRGQNSVEFISVWRESVELDRNRINAPIARRGLSLNYTSGTTTDILTVKAIPAKIKYSIRFWSRSLDKVSDAIETYLFWIHSNPNLIFNYVDLYPLEFDIIPQGIITDESTILTQYNTGLYFVNKAEITLDGWILSASSIKTILQIILNVYLRETVNNQNVDTLLNTYTIESTIAS